MTILSKFRTYYSFLRTPILLQFKIRTCNFSKSTCCFFKNPLRRKYSPKTFANDSKEVSRVCVTIIGNGAIGQPRCIGLFTDHKAFLFNCGEGVCRLLREYEADFFHLKYAFITQNIWNNVCGLSDIHITHSAFAMCGLNLFGPPGVEFFRDLITSDVSSTQLNKRTLPYCNDTFEIDSICIQAENSNSFGRKRMEDTVFSYSCKILEMPSELIPEKLVEHNVPIGPHLLKLKKGEDVLLPSGKVIHAIDVIDSFKKEEILLVVDCPSHSFLLPFVKHEKFSQYQLPSDAASKVSTVFHFSPPNIIATKKYQDWMKNFHPKTQHVILNASCSEICGEAAYQTQSILHHLHPDIFKLLPNSKTGTEECNSSLSIMHPPSMLQINYRPQKTLNWSNVLSYVPQSFVQDTQYFPEFNDELRKLNSIISSNSQFLSNATQTYPQVIFLGTSSSTSTAYRNVTAILLNLTSQKSILLDCGEGTFTQFVRYFGAENVDIELRKISCIFVSHLHVDHYLGLFQLLIARIEAFKKSGRPYQPVALILPYSIRTIFKRFCEIYDPIYSKVRIFTCKSLTDEIEKTDKLDRFLEDVEIQTVPVKHCYDGYGIVVKKGSDWKIVYSGDTAPCQKLIDAGENCTLLIHEASIEDDFENEALARKHSTPSQVVDISEKMNAQHTILTHFSKRYLAVPIFNNDNKNVGCAFDFMKVELHQLPLVPLFLPAMRYLFPEQLEKQSANTSFVVNFENSFMKSYKDYHTKNVKVKYRHTR